MIDTKEQAKKKEIEYAEQRIDRYITVEIVMYNNCFRVFCKDADGRMQEKFPFAEPKFGDLAWCWFEHCDKDMMLQVYNGFGWCSTRHAVKYASEKFGTKFGHVETLGINIAHLLEGGDE